MRLPGTRCGWMQLRPGGHAARASSTCCSGQRRRAAASWKADGCGMDANSSGIEMRRQRRADAEPHRIAGGEDDGGRVAQRQTWSIMRPASIACEASGRVCHLDHARARPRRTCQSRVAGAEDVGRSCAIGGEASAAGRRRRPRRRRRCRARGSCGDAPGDGVEGGAGDGRAAAAAEHGDEGDAAGCRASSRPCSRRRRRSRRASR